MAHTLRICLVMQLRASEKQLDSGRLCPHRRRLAVTASAQVASEMAAQLGIRGDGSRPLTEAVSRAAYRSYLCIVLDNCEHIPGVADLVAGLGIGRHGRHLPLLVRHQLPAGPGQQRLADRDSILRPAARVDHADVDGQEPLDDR